MKILFYCQWPDKKAWLKYLKLKFKKHKIYTVEDKFNYEDIEIAIIWKLPNTIYSNLINLKIVFSLGAGVDHILSLKSYNNTPIVRIKDVNMAKRMSNYAHSQILNYQLKLNLYNKAQRKKKWLEEQSTPHNNQITIGILGVGYLGKYLGRYLKRLDYQVIGYKASPVNKKIAFFIYTKRKINNFIKESDIIVSLLPGTKETENFIDKKFLKKMKKKSLLINIGRGSSLNEEDIIEHLTQNKNFYASLDVFKNEPLKRNHKLWNNPNVIITPHVAATSDIESSVDYIYQRFLNFIEKDKFVSDVNLKKGY